MELKRLFKLHFDYMNIILNTSLRHENICINL